MNNVGYSQLSRSDRRGRLCSFRAGLADLVMLARDVNVQLQLDNYQDAGRGTQSASVALTLTETSMVSV